MDALREAKAVAFLAAVRRIGTIKLRRLEPDALLLQFELKADRRALEEFTGFFPQGYTLQQLVADFGAELIALLAAEGED